MSRPIKNIVNPLMSVPSTEFIQLIIPVGESTVYSTIQNIR